MIEIIVIKTTLMLTIYAIIFCLSIAFLPTATSFWADFLDSWLATIDGCDMGVMQALRIQIGSLDNVH